MSNFPLAGQPVKHQPGVARRIAPRRRPTRPSTPGPELPAATLTAVRP